MKAWEGINWAQVVDAYGPAGDLPKLWAKVEAGDPKALRRIMGRFAHQGQGVEALGAVAEVLVALVREGAGPRRELLVALGDCLGWGSHTNIVWDEVEGLAEHPDVIACRERVRGVTAELVASLGDAEARTRAAATLPLGLLGGAAAVEALAGALAGEEAPEVVASLLFALDAAGALDQADPAAKERARRAFGAPRWALLMVEARTARTLEAARTLRAEKVKNANKVPWLGGELAEPAQALPLEILAEHGALDELMAIAREASLRDALPLLVRVLWPEGRTSDDPVEAAALNPAQRALVELVAAEQAQGHFIPTWSLERVGVLNVQRLASGDPGPAWQGTSLHTWTSRYFNGRAAEETFIEALRSLPDDARLSFARVLAFDGVATFPPTFREERYATTRATHERQDRLYAVLAATLSDDALAALTAEAAEHDLHLALVGLCAEYIPRLAAKRPLTPAENDLAAQALDSLHSGPEALRRIFSALDLPTRERIAVDADYNLLVSDGVLYPREAFLYADLAPTPRVRAAAQAALDDEEDEPPPEAAEFLAAFFAAFK